MFHRIPLRFPITTMSPAGKRIPAPFRTATRFSSNTSSSRAARVISLAAQAEKPSALEAGVPIMWAVCGALIYTAFERVGESGAEDVEKLLIV